MDNKEKEQITHMFIDAVKEASQYLVSTGNAHKYDPAFLELLTARRIEPKREAILIRLLKDSTCALRCSEEYLDQLLSKKLRDVIYKLITKEPGPLNKKAREAAREFFERLDGITSKYIVYLPVSGITLQLEGEKLILGNITLQKMTQERVDEAIGYLSNGVMALANIPEEKQQFIDLLAPRLKAIFENAKNTVWAIYQDNIEAEPIRARKRAEEECYKVFDLLLYSLPVLYPKIYPKQFYIPPEHLEDTVGKSGNQQQIGIEIEREQGKYISFGLKEDIGETIRHVIMFTDQPSFNWETKRDDGAVPLVLRSEDLEGLDWIGVFEVSKIISGEENITNFKRTLLRSLHWYANAQIQMQWEYIFLSLVSSIEAFFNPPGSHEQVTSAVTEGVAALIGTEKDFKYVKKRVDALYTKRSALTHGDQIEIFERDIYEMREIASQIIRQMISRRNEFTTQEQFFEAIKNIREMMKQCIATTKRGGRCKNKARPDSKYCQVHDNKNKGT